MELMVVLLIVALLVGLAWPNYQAHVRRSQRIEALAALLEAQQHMERLYAAQGRYTTAAGGAPSLPQRLQAVPSRESPRYLLELASVDAGSYTLRAVPQGDQANDACGSLTLASTGARGCTGTGATVAQCWQ